MIDFLFKIFQKFPKTGLLPDDPNWVSSLPRHELFAGGNGQVVNWASMAPPFRYQESTTMCTAFAGCAVASMLNKRETGESVVFSPLELFTRSKGEIYGNTVQNTIQAMKSGVFPESICPWISPISEWNPLILQLLRAYAKASVRADSSPGEPFAIKSVTNIIPDRNSIYSALFDSPVILIVQVGNGYFNQPAPAVSSGSLHAVVATGVTSDGFIQIFDSLTQTKTFDGFHWLSPQFNVLFAFGILDLPNDWQKIQANTERYGKTVNTWAETNAEAEINLAGRKNPTHASLLAKNKKNYIMALSYGGYTIQDILNHVTSIRRTGSGIFDLSKPHP